MTCTRLFAASRPNSAVPQTVGLMATACLHVITKASQTFPVLCTWVPFFLISPTITFRIRYLYRQLLPSCIFLSVIFYFILQWVPTGRRFAWFSASPAAPPLPQIKSDKVEWKLKTPARRFYNHPLVLSRLKNFVKVPGYTGLCVDTENAAVWASASSAFSVSFLAKFCTPWYLRSSELRQIQRMIHKTPCPEFIYFKFPLTGNPLSSIKSISKFVDIHFLSSYTYKVRNEFFYWVRLITWKGISFLFYFYNII